VRAGQRDNLLSLTRCKAFCSVHFRQTAGRITLVGKAAAPTEASPPHRAITYEINNALPRLFANRFCGLCSCRLQFERFQIEAEGRDDFGDSNSDYLEAGRSATGEGR
jgi:hypothetical protein